MRSSDRLATTRPAPERSVWPARVVAVIFAAVGVLVAAAGIASGDAALAVPTGAGVAAFAGAAWAGGGSRPDVRSRLRPATGVAGGTGTAGSPGPVLDLGLRPQPLWVTVLIAVALCLFGLVGILGVGPTDGGLLFSPLLLLGLLLLPDATRALRRGARLRADRQTVDLRGWGQDAVVAWDEVDAVELTTRSGRLRLVVRGRPDAASWHSERHRVVLPLDPRPTGHELSVAATALDAPGATAALLRRLAHATPAERDALLGPAGAELLLRDA